MNKYPKYKDSGVEWIGQVPQNWALKPIKRLFKIVNGATPTSTVPEFWDGNIPWVTPDDLGSNSSMIINDTRRQITDQGYKSCGTTLVPEGSLVMSTRAPIGYLAIAGKPMCSNQGCKSLICLNDIHNKYYYYFLSASKEYIDIFGKGSTFKELGRDDLAAIPITEPTKNETVQIAKFLDDKTSKINDLITKKECMIELLKEQRAAVINEAVTKGLDPNVKMKDSGVEWIGEVPEHWGIKRLKFVGQAIIGLTYSPDEVSDSGILVLRSSNVQNRHISLEDNVYVNKEINQKLIVREGDILICSRNGSRSLIGKCAYITREYEGHSFGAFMTVFRSNANRFLYHIFNSTIFEYHISSFLTATINQLTTENLNGIIIAVPPLNEQVAISDYLYNKTGLIDDAIDKEIQGIVLLKKYRSSLISEVVTGKVII